MPQARASPPSLWRGPLLLHCQWAALLLSHATTVVTATAMICDAGFSPQLARSRQGTSIALSKTLHLPTTNWPLCSSDLSRTAPDVCLCQALPLASRFLLASDISRRQAVLPRGGESKHYSGKVGNRAATRNGLASRRSGTLQSDHRSSCCWGGFSRTYWLQTSIETCSSVQSEARTSVPLTCWGTA
jgi:hypothetical protein